MCGSSIQHEGAPVAAAVAGRVAVSSMMEPQHRFLNGYAATAVAVHANEQQQQHCCST